MKRACVLAALLAACLSNGAAAAPMRRPALMTYYESWLAPAGREVLTRVPRFLDIVALSFARPDARYAGDLDLRGTGLEFRSTGVELRDAVRLLHGANPAVRVVLSVGGSGYADKWPALDEAALARLVRDLGLDGVDVDYEPTDPACQAAGGGLHCASDAQWPDILSRVRRAVPRPALVSVPGWSVGAYGTSPWQDARPRSPWTGSMLAPLTNPGPAAIDLVAVMAYEAGPLFEPSQAYAAYRAAWPGPLLGGVEVSGGAPAIAGPDGLMIYGWLGAPPAGRPDATAIARAACKMWRPDCD